MKSSLAPYVEALVMLGLQSSFRRNKSIVNEQKDDIMNLSSIENVQPEQKPNREPEADSLPSAQVLQCYAPFSGSPLSELYNMDCVEGMKHYPDKYFDLAIVDPPYGIGGFTQSETKKYGDYQWNELPPTDEYFIELKRISKNRIIWGANYYNCFEGGNAAIIWNKQNPHPSLSVCEIASVSWGKRINYFEYQWHGLAMHRIRSGFHPCEKPVALYNWILKNYAEPGQRILDTHVGSGSSRIACYNNGFDFVGFEIDKDYCEASEKRFRNAIMQQRLF